MKNAAVAFLLVALAVAVWGYDLHLAVRPLPPSVGVNSETLTGPSPVTATPYPWHEDRLPLIPWRMEAPQAVTPAENNTHVPPVPDLELIGLFYAEGQEAALLRNLGTGKTFLLRDRESFQGVTLVSADRDSVTLSTGSQVWRLALPSHRGGAG